MQFNKEMLQKMKRELLEFTFKAEDEIVQLQHETILKVALIRHEVERLLSRIEVKDDE